MRTKTDKYKLELDTTMYCFMVSEVFGDLELYFKGTDTGISTRISLCHSGFKGPAVSSVSLRNSDFQ